MSFEVALELTEIEEDIAYQKYLRQIDSTPEWTAIWGKEEENEKS